MCTLTYLPLGADSFILTSNRDESPKRQPEGIFHNIEKALYYPKEPTQGGTWIAVAENNRVLCLLNGAFDRHKHEPPYKRSRGLVVLDFFDYSDAPDFHKQYNFEGIEPFTLFIYDRGDLFEIRWDGTLTHFNPLESSKPYIWSSSTLYPENIKKMRQDWFDAWLKDRTVFTAADILNFHQSAGIGDPENDLIMSRYEGKLCTVSHTQILKERNQVQMFYQDRVSDRQYRTSFKIHSSV